MNTLATILGALVPLFGLIVIGAALARADFPGDGFWPDLGRLIYYFLFPALLVESLATADVDPNRLVPVFLAAGGTIALGSALTFALQPLLRLNGPDLTSLYQGGIRFNTYLGIAVVLAVYGEPAMAVTAVVIAIMVPLINLGCVLVLSRFNNTPTTAAYIAGSLVKNPLIIGCVLGLLLNVGGIGLHPWLASLLEIAGSAAVPLGLISVGAGLRMGALRRTGAPMVGAAAVKLVAMPAIAWGLAVGIGLSTLETQVLVLFAALPTATSAYILARQMGGNFRLVAGMLTLQTAISALTLPLVLALLARHLG